MPSVGYDEPVALSRYDYYLVENVNVYIDKLARADIEGLKFVLKNFLMLKYIEVEGVKLM